MKKHKKRQWISIILAAVVLKGFAVAHYDALIREGFPTNCDAHLAEGIFQICSGISVKAYAQELGSLASVTGEAKILPISDGNHKYLLKSDGFYCLNEDGTKDGTQAVHYFDHLVVDGTVFNGYYYHDESGKFKAGEGHLVSIPETALPLDEEGNPIKGWTAGIYMVNNLGRLTSSPKAVWIEETEIEKTKLNGCYYFNKNGRLLTEGGIFYIEGQMIQDETLLGYYYFDEKTGLLLGEGTTPEGFHVDAEGKIQELTEPGIRNLESALETLTADYEGEWSIYIKDLKKKKKVVINDKAMPSASLIKTFTMAASYENMAAIRENEAQLLKTDAASDSVSNKIYRLMENMVTYSDNESFNEMIRLQTSSGQFNAGARNVNRYLRNNDYENTAVLHTLSPSATESEGIGANNVTSVGDCGLLLERIYRKKCVSKEASAQMLDLLLAQDTRTKIPGGLSEEIKVANKTGENDLSQHDIAIVYGEKTDYVICVMSENTKSEEEAINHIRTISALTYYYLNR